MDALSDPRAFLSAQEKRAEQLKAIGVGDDDISTNDVIVTKKATSNSGKSAGSGGPQPPSMGYPPGLPPKKTVEKGSGTLECWIDHTVGKKFTRLENVIDIGGRATEMSPNIKAIDIWLSALENV